MNEGDQFELNFDKEPKEDKVTVRHPKTGEPATRDEIIEAIHRNKGDNPWSYDLGTEEEEEEENLGEFSVQALFIKTRKLRSEIRDSQYRYRQNVLNGSDKESQKMVDWKREIDSMRQLLKSAFDESDVLIETMTPTEPLQRNDLVLIKLSVTKESIKGDIEAVFKVFNVDSENGQITIKPLLSTAKGDGQTVAQDMVYKVELNF